MQVRLGQLDVMNTVQMQIVTGCCDAVLLCVENEHASSLGIGAENMWVCHSSYRCFILHTPHSRHTHFAMALLVAAVPLPASVSRCLFFHVG